MTLSEVKEELDLSIGTSGIATCENLLEKAGAIERLDSKQNSAAIRIDSELSTLIDMLPRDAVTQRTVMRELERVVGSCRNEMVMFQPKFMAERLEMKWDSVARAIREITKLDAVTYVPPFRGRAIHMKCRDKAFAQLDIDFAELARRQKAEMEKLQSVIKLSTTKRCRQLEILEYFGDPDRRRCGNCDNCGGFKKLVATDTRSAEADACLYAAQVALSGAARTHGRLGKNLVASMLKGSTAKKVSQLGLNRLSTYGLLSTLRQSDIVSLLEFLIQCGFIEQFETTKFRPTIRMADAAKDILAGDRYIDLTQSMPPALVKEITRRLRNKQPFLTETAEPVDDAADTSSTVVETDESVEATPKAIEAAAEYHEPIEQEEATPNIVSATDAPQVEPANVLDTETIHTSDVAESRIDLPQAEDIQPSFYWTWRLLTQGYRPHHIQQVRNLDQSTIFSHAIRAAESNMPMKAQWLMDESQIAALETFVAGHPNQRPASMLSDLPEGISAGQLLLFLKTQKQ